MEWVETTGRTVAEAKDAALDQLGVDEHDAEFEILAEPRSGLFGRLRTEARVRARVRPTRPRAKEERGRRGRARADGGRGPRSTGAAGGEADEDSAAGRAGAGARSTRARPAASAADPGGGEGSAASSRTSRPSRRRRGAGTGPGGGEGGRAGGDDRARPRPSRAAGSDDEGSREVGEDDRAMNDDVPMEEQAEVARRFLVGLLEEFDAAGSTVDVRTVDDETVELAVVGEDLGLLIGPKGATLQAVQELTRTVVQRKTGGHNGRLLVDVAGYREKRKAALERFAREVADEVLASGTRRVLEPMQPADRKVVHDVVNTIEGVTTASEGEDPRRRVVIQPST